MKKIAAFLAERVPTGQISVRRRPPRVPTTGSWKRGPRKKGLKLAPLHNSRFIATIRKMRKQGIAVVMRLSALAAQRNAMRQISRSMSSIPRPTWDKSLEELDPEIFGLIRVSL